MQRLGPNAKKKRTAWMNKNRYLGFPIFPCSHQMTVSQVLWAPFFLGVCRLGASGAFREFQDMAMSFEARLCFGVWGSHPCIHADSILSVAVQSRCFLPIQTLPTGTKPQKPSTTAMPKRQGTACFQSYKVLHTTVIPEDSATKPQIQSAEVCSSLQERIVSLQGCSCAHLSLVQTEPPSANDPDRPCTQLFWTVTSPKLRRPHPILMVVCA